MKKPILSKLVSCKGKDAVFAVNLMDFDVIFAKKWSVIHLLTFSHEISHQDIKCQYRLQTPGPDLTQFRQQNNLQLAAPV
jgi:hypothetical protein